VRDLPDRPAHRRRRARAPGAPTGAGPPGRRQGRVRGRGRDRSGDRRSGRRAVARMGGRVVPVLHERPREPVPRGAIHWLRPGRRLRRALGRRRALLSGDHERVRSARGGPAAVRRHDRLPGAPARRRRRASRALRVRQRGADRDAGGAGPGAGGVRLHAPRGRGDAARRARARVRLGGWIDRAASGAVGRRDPVRRGRGPRASGARRRRAGRDRGVRRDPHVGHPPVPLRAAVGGACPAFDREPDAAGGGGGSRRSRPAPRSARGFEPSRSGRPTRRSRRRGAAPRPWCSSPDGRP
jgi:hypothetical protein